MVSLIYIRHVFVILTGKMHGIIGYYSTIRGSKNRLCSDHRNSKDKEKEGNTAAQVDVRPQTRGRAVVIVLLLYPSIYLLEVRGTPRPSF